MVCFKKMFDLSDGIDSFFMISITYIFSCLQKSADIRKIISNINYKVDIDNNYYNPY